MQIINFITIANNKKDQNRRIKDPSTLYHS